MFVKSNLFEVLIKKFLDLFLLFCSEANERNFKQIGAKIKLIETQLKQLAISSKISDQSMRNYFERSKHILDYFFDDDVDLMEIYILNIIRINPEVFDFEKVKLLISCKLYLP